MAKNIVRLPMAYFGDPKRGRPISNGSVYIGEPDLDPEVLGNRKEVILHQEDGTDVTISPAAQPLKTGAGGYILYDGSPVTVITNGNYSLKVNGRFGGQKFYVDNAAVATGADTTTAVVETIAEMTADHFAETGDYYNCGDYADGHNAGILTFKVVESGTGTADGGSYIDHDTLSVQFERIFNVAVSVKDFGAAGDWNGATGTDDTVAIQAALDYTQKVYIPTGEYLNTAPLEYHANQLIFGDGSRQTLIVNDTTDAWQRDTTATQDFYTQINGIGCKRASPGGITTAFNCINTTYLQFTDIYVENFYCGIFIQRDSVNFGGTNAQWYNRYNNITMVNIAFGIWIDYLTGGSGNSCNSNIFSNITMVNKGAYYWNTTAGLTTAGIRYQGYSNFFSDAYIKGFSHHIWRDDKGGNNIFDRIYLESDIILGEMVYAPTITTTYYNNVDYIYRFRNEDGRKAIEDPYNIFTTDYLEKVDGIDTGDQQKLSAGSFITGQDRIRNGAFSSNTDEWVAVSGAVLSSVAGGFSGNCLQLQQPTTSIVYASQTFPTVPGVTYRVVVYHKDGTAGTGRLLIGTSQTGGQYINISTISSVAWTRYEHSFTATDTLAYMTLGARAGGAGDYQLYDSISVVARAVTTEGDMHVFGEIEVGSISSSGSTPRIISGEGSPEGVRSAPEGSIYMNSLGGAGVSSYGKESGGTGNTGWVAK